jgi:hypothetical protein
VYFVLRWKNLCTFAIHKISSKNMETISIGLASPQARKLIDDLAELKVITIEPQPSFAQVLARLRNNETTAPSLEIITQEVETVRKARYNAGKA